MTSFKWRYLFLGIFILLLTLGLYFFVLIKPSNNRTWVEGEDILPKFTINGDLVKIDDVRDFHYDIGKTISKGRVSRTLDASKITKVWFVQEPFVIKPFTSFKGVAHTYFAFDFSDQEPMVVSVEARREDGEAYEAFKGLFNQYEMIYVWGNETDETVSRVVVENNKLFMFPLQITNQGAQQLFLQMAQASHELETTPRFYNTFSSNCTNELSKAANKVKSNAIPLNIALFLPGYSDQELYKLDYIPNSLPLESEKQKYYISDLVRQYYNQPDFSQKLRSNLQ